MQTRLKAGFASLLLTLFAAIGLLVAGSNSLRVSLTPTTGEASPPVIPTSSYTPLPVLQIDSTAEGIGRATAATPSPAELAGRASAGSTTSSVVAIVGGDTPGVTTDPERASPQGDDGLLGSGVIIDSEGHVCTERHVLVDTDSLAVVLADGTRLHATVVGEDNASGLAVLKVNDSVAAAASFADSRSLQAGDSVWSLGARANGRKIISPGSILSITAGPGRPGSAPDLIWTNVPALAGLRGGPLVNASGQLVGIVIGQQMSPSGAPSVIAISGNAARVTAQALIRRSGGQAYLGVSFVPVTPEIERYYQLPSNSGAWVTDVLPDGPAARAGIVPDSVITRFDGTVLNAETGLAALLLHHRGGETITLTIIRPGTTVEQDVRVVLGTHPTDH